MFLGEPERTAVDLNFRLFGIPIRIHPMFWLIGILLGPFRSGLAEVAVWLVAFLIGVLCHEIGHAVVIRSYGFYPWITLYALGGWAAYDPGYRASPSGLRQILISAAGPGAGFLLAAVLVAALVLTGHQVGYVLGAPFGLYVLTPELIFRPAVTWLINDLLFVTIVYGILNLLPIYPLDGGKIAREVMLLANSRGGIRQSLILSLVVAAVLGGLGLVLYRDVFLAVFFGALALGNYSALQAYGGRGSL